MCEFLATGIFCGNFCLRNFLVGISGEIFGFWFQKFFVRNFCSTIFSLKFFLGHIFPENLTFKIVFLKNVMAPREFFSADFDCTIFFFFFFFRSRIFASRFGSPGNFKISVHSFSPLLPVRPNSNFQAFFFFFFFFFFFEKNPCKNL